jgi:flagellin
VDLNNSDLKAGMALTTTAPAVTATSGTGLYATGGANAATGLNDVSSGLLLGVGNTGTTATTYAIVLDPAMSPKLSGNFILSSNGSNLTLTGTLNGLAASQTVVVSDATSNATGGTAKRTDQTLDFSNFGIKLNLSSTRAASDTLTGSTIATKLATAAYNTLNVTGINGEVTDVRLSGVAPGTYSLTYNETGTIGSLGLPAVQSGRVTAVGAGVLYNVALTGGATGSSGATANVTYDATGAVTGIAINNAGTGYKAGDILGIATANVVAAPTNPITVATTQGSNGATPANETAAITIGAGGLIAGQSVRIAGLTFTATAAVSQAQLGTAFASLSDGATGAATANAAAMALIGKYSGTLSGFSTSAVISNVITASSTITGTNVTDIATSFQGNAAIATAMTGIVVGKDITATSGTKTLTMSGSINGANTTQSLTVSDNAALATETFNFSSFGVQFDVKSYQGQSATQIGTALATLNGLGGTTSFGNPGELIVSQGNNSALKFQSGANSDAFIQIDTLNIQTATSGAYAGTSSEMTTLGTRITDSSAGNIGSLGLNDTIETWQTAFKNVAASVDNALEYISTKRATYGSQMNRLSYVSTNLQAQSTNLQNSRSAIIDTDFAAETAKLTKGQIMQQAATAMLAQANQMPNVILSLLK